MSRFYKYDSLDSTNDKAKELAKRKISDAVIIAETQLKGKGRFNRRWESDHGGLYMSILLRERDISKIKYLTFIAAISVCETINQNTKLKAKVKWPNDVLVSEKKICGILTENILGKENFSIVGIGLNVNQDKFPESFIYTPTSLFLETGKGYSVEKLAEEIAGIFEKYHSYYLDGDYDPIISLWKSMSCTLGEEVAVRTMGKTYSGKAIDIDVDCSLVIELGNGKLKKISEGDVLPS